MIVLCDSIPARSPSLSKPLSKKRKSEPSAVFVPDRLAREDIYRVKLAVAIARDVCLQQIQRHHASNIELRMSHSKSVRCALVVDAPGLQYTHPHGIFKLWPMLIGCTLRHIVRRFGGPSFISLLTLITTRVSSVAALGSRKSVHLMLEGIANRVFGKRLCELLESSMRCAISQMVITRPEKHSFCPFLLALKKHAKKRIEGEVDAWTAAKIGDAGLVELHVLAIVQEPDYWRGYLCDAIRQAPQMAYFCCDYEGHNSDK
jgi:hypothetical protein